MTDVGSQIDGSEGKNTRNGIITYPVPENR